MSQTFQWGNTLRGLLFAGILSGSALSSAKAADEVFGTIVSIRGNILAVHPSLRPKMTRVTFDDKTVIIAYERSAMTALKPGMRVGMGGTYSESEGFHPRFIEAAEKPIGRLAEKSDGIRKEGGWAQATGTLKSIEPFVFTDDNGKEYSAKLDRLGGVWHDFLTDRNGLLIGTRIFATGTLAPDGVLQATTISPDQNTAAEGTMFGTITAVHGSTVTIRPRYTTDALEISLAKNGTLLREIPIDPDTIHIGDPVTFWGEQRNHPWDNPKSSDMKATALMLGPYRYPKGNGAEAGVFLTGKIASIDPVKLTLPSGETINVIIPAQMPIVRLEPVRADDLKPGASAMLVLSRRPDGSFETSTIILDASPFVGYGG